LWMCSQRGAVGGGSVKRDTLAWWEDALMALWLWLAVIRSVFQSDRSGAPRAPRGW